MKIYWLGHACFLIESNINIVTDPFDSKIGYPEPRVAADVVTVSHQHYDHNAVKVLPGEPRVIKSTGRHDIGGGKITGIPSFHDNSGGSQRGENIIFIIEAEGLRICHLGDLGHNLDGAALEQIGAVDVLLLPVGGVYTIDASGAKDVVDGIKPRYVIPMHYKTSHLNLSIAPVDKFLNLYPTYNKQKILEIQPESKQEKMQLVVLELSTAESPL